MPKPKTLKPREALRLSRQRNQELTAKLARFRNAAKILEEEKRQLQEQNSQLQMFREHGIKGGRMAASSFKDFTFEFAMVLSARNLSHFMTVHPGQVQALKEQMVVEIARKMLEEGFIWFEQLPYGSTLSSPLIAVAVVGRPTGKAQP